MSPTLAWKTSAFDSVTVELVGVTKVLESAKNHAQQRRDRLAPLERLERDRAVEHDVVGERVHHPVEVPCLDGLS